MKSLLEQMQQIPATVSQPNYGKLRAETGAITEGASLLTAMQAEPQNFQKQESYGLMKDFVSNEVKALSEEKTKPPKSDDGGLERTRSDDIGTTQRVNRGRFMGYGL